VNVNSRNTAAILAGVGVSVIVMVILAYAGTIRPPIPNDQNSSTNTSPAGMTTTVPRLRLVLTVLKGNEDNSIGVASYNENNTTPIALSKDQHIRFESPDFRKSDGMKVIAIEPDGKIHILLKSYDVNNKYFINNDRGPYAIRVQARWLDSTYFYSFNV